MHAASRSHPRLFRTGPKNGRLLEQETGVVMVEQTRASRRGRRSPGCMVRAPAAGVSVLLLEIDRRTKDAHDLVTKLRRYRQWGRPLPRDADKHTVGLVRSGPDAIEHVGHAKRRWRRSSRPPAGRTWCHSGSCSPPPSRRRPTTR
ncbi:hypothetical protein [Streptomyces lavendofoliae]|uniref:hypothetical protein n=1 Tax=Streptomyces lavendofoliae TaxID=67314 RepID=UPI00300ED0BC